MANPHAGGDPRNVSPTIDHRTTTHLLEQIKRMAPYYTPEWRFRPDDPDPGTALSLLFVQLLEGNIRRLNQVPYKSFLAFLNRFHVELAEARPALAQVTFELAEGAPESVFVEKGTQLAAAVPGETDPILFETSRPILVTSARIMDVLTISPKRDRIVKLAEEGTELAALGEDRGLAMYGLEEDNLQEHAVYLRHDFLFYLEHPAFIEFEFFNAENAYALEETVKLLTDPKMVSWEYYSGGTWETFDRVHGIGSTLRLVKLRHLPVEPFEFNGETGQWIRCRANSLDESTGAVVLNKVQLDRLTMKSEFAPKHDEDGIIPERLYYNDIQLSSEEGCQPYGEFFSQYGLFYIANKEAFSKRGAHITIRFDLKFDRNRLVPDKPPEINWKMIMKRHEVDKTEIPDPVTIAHVQWEYWNGSAWVMLVVNPEASTLFSVPWEGTETREVSFVCPQDLEAFFVNAEENFWIRGRIVQINNAYSPNAIYFSPFIKRMRIRYGYDKPVHPPQILLTCNNLEIYDRTNEVKTGGLTFRPFLTLEGQHPAFWIGFNSPPERGPISLYMSLRGRRTTERDIPFLEWEYLRKVGGSAVWSTLAVADDTNGFTRSGEIQFIGPQDFALTTHFGVSRYWIRAVNRDGRYDEESEASNVPRVLGLVLNTTQAVQQRTNKDELPQMFETYDTMEERITEYFVLSETPVLTEEVWVDETDALSYEEAIELENRGIQVDLLRDSENEILRIWVEYQAVEQFLNSGPQDRHYTIDKASGRITFGNGIHGKKLPRAGEDTIRVTYTSGGGVRGNVPADSITSMQESIAFIDSVTNRFPAAGGCDSGTVEEAIVRGPKLFTHRNRAVTAEDFEWLTREAHPNVAKVKCLPNMNAKLEPEPGAISIVVLPKSGIGSGSHFLELKRAIESSLLDIAASNIAFPNNIQVMEPALLEINVHATVWVDSMEKVVPVERELIRMLNAFLDPIAGNSDGLGWGIGEIVHSSMFYALLKSAGPVLHIPQLSIHVTKVDNGERIEVNPEHLSEIPHGVVVPGAHRMIVEVSK